MIVYLVCESFIVYDNSGHRAEDGFEIISAFLEKENALLKLENLNKGLELEEGDEPFFIKPLGVN